MINFAPKQVIVMANTLVKVYLHIVFHIKNRHSLIREEDLPRLFEYIGGTIKAHGGIPLKIGGINTHVHILTSLPKNMPLPYFVREIKAKSSKWIKTIARCYNWFAWQEGYGAFSVSPSLLSKTKQYIENQAEHHNAQSYDKEFKEFLRAYEIECDANTTFGEMEE